jgi:hypothetical protein
MTYDNDYVYKTVNAAELEHHTLEDWEVIERYEVSGSQVLTNTKHVFPPTQDGYYNHNNVRVNETNVFGPPETHSQFLVRRKKTAETYVRRLENMNGAMRMEKEKAEKRVEELERKVASIDKSLAGQMRLRDIEREDNLKLLERLRKLEEGIGDERNKLHRLTTAFGEKAVKEALEDKD